MTSKYKSSLNYHQQAEHKEKKYHGGEWDNQVTSEGHLNQHQLAVHGGRVKYQSREYDCQANTKISFTQRQVIGT